MPEISSILFPFHLSILPHTTQRTFSAAWCVQLWSVILHRDRAPPQRSNTAVAPAFDEIKASSATNIPIDYAPPELHHFRCKHGSQSLGTTVTHTHTSLAAFAAYRMKSSSRKGFENDAHLCTPMIVDSIRSLTRLIFVCIPPLLRLLQHNTGTTVSSTRPRPRPRSL